MSKKEEFRKGFITRYRVAMKLKLTREQLSYLMEVKPDSLMRKRLFIYEETGLNLPYLKTIPGSENLLDEDKKADFYSIVDEMMSENDEKTSLHEYVEDPNTVKRLIITSAQNATPINEKFLSSIHNFCEENNAQLVVIPYRYRNPTSMWTHNNAEDEYWHNAISDYIIDSEVKLCEGLMLMGNIKLQPTAVNPLSGFDSFTGNSSAIFGHPKIQLKTVPTPSQKIPKIQLTTGSITVHNYTDSKAGHKGRFHHSFGATVVEIDRDGKYHLRHVHANDDTGEFYDLDKKYTPEGVEKDIRIVALVTGDTHAEFIDEKVKKATYTGENSIVNALKPEILVWHDVEDFYARNHHHRGNDLISYGKHHFGRNNVEESLQVTADLIDECSMPNMLNVIVKSNHDEALDRWLREASGKDDPENDRFFHYMKYHQYKNMKMTETGYQTIDPFEFWCYNPDQFNGLRNRDNTKFLKRDESFMVNGIEVGFHGDVGLNGARGSVQAFAKIGSKVIIGHSHSPAIFEGAYQVGVSASTNLEYVSGPSSWLHTHCIIYPDAHRTLVHIIDGKWRALD